MTKRAPTISHSRAPLRLSGSTPKTNSIQFLWTKVITNNIQVTMAMLISSQKRRLNALFIGSTLPFAKQHDSTQSKKEATSIRNDPFSDTTIVPRISCIPHRGYYGASMKNTRRFLERRHAEKARFLVLSRLSKTSLVVTEPTPLRANLGSLFLTGSHGILLLHKTNVFERAQPCLIDPWFEILNQLSPMMRFSPAVSTTSLVTTWSWFATKTCSTCIIRRSITGNCSSTFKAWVQ